MWKITEGQLKKTILNKIWKCINPRIRGKKNFLYISYKAVAPTGQRKHGRQKDVATR